MKKILLSAAALTFVGGAAFADTGQAFIHGEDMFGPQVLTISATAELPHDGIYGPAGATMIILATNADELIIDNDGLSGDDIQLPTVALDAQEADLLSATSFGIADLMVDPGAPGNIESLSFIIAGSKADVDPGIAPESHIFLTANRAVDEAGPLQDLATLLTVAGVMDPGELNETDLMIVAGAQAGEVTGGEALQWTTGGVA